MSTLHPVREVLIGGLVNVLRPIIRILLRNGLGFSEFSSIAKSLYVESATQEFGLRGRPTNTSRVASLVGLSRREVKKIRSIGKIKDWNPGMESSPINNVIHFWNFDGDFCIEPGKPRPLSTVGGDEFSVLVKRYARDVPVSVMKKELLISGTAAVDADDRIRLLKRYFQPDDIGLDFVRNIFFSLQNHAVTAAHNYSVATASEPTSGAFDATKHFERSAWTNYLAKDDVAEFSAWVRNHGQKFLEMADDWIGTNEVPHADWSQSNQRTVGVGVYYFDSPPANSDDAC